MNKKKCKVCNIPLENHWEIYKNGCPPVDCNCIKGAPKHIKDKNCKKKSIYDEPEANEWILPVRKGYKIACCDCGLVHKIDFRIKDKRIEIRFNLDNRATGQIRRRNHYGIKNKECRTCTMPMKKLKFGKKIMWGCNNINCDRPELREATNTLEVKEK